MRKLMQFVVTTTMLAAGLVACGGGGDSGGSGTGGAPPPAPQAAVAGTVEIINDSVADSDVNDPQREYVPNDEPGQQQPVPNPATVGGYANQPGAGEPGPSRDAGDTTDGFTVPLAAGESVNLFVADPEAGDLDLFLLDEELELVDSSEGVGHDESVTAPRDGAYTILVFAYSGATNYLMQVGAEEATATHAMRYDADFVPGEIIAAFDEAKAAGALGATSRSRADALGLQALGGAPGRPMLLGVPSAGIPAALGTTPAASSWRHHVREFDIRRLTLRAIKALARRDDVAYAEPNLRRYATAIPDDPFFPQQWHYTAINLPLAWDLTRGATSVRVAVVDTGVVLEHPDLAGQFDPQDPDGFDFIRDPITARDGDGRDSNASDPGDDVRAGASSFHGTHVAGTVAAATDNDIGVAGVAWHARIMPLRVLGLGGGSSFDVQQAVLYAAGLPNDTGRVPAEPADVINLSLGGPSPSSSERQTYERVAAAGVLIAAAAGNSNNEQLSYPASYDSVVSVAAVGRSMLRAPYSQFNAAVDVAAPGGDMRASSRDGVLSTHATDSSGRIVPIYSYFAGTSMATPHVAGVMALMRTVHPALTQRDFLDLLATGAITQDLGPSGRDNSFGWGLIDARKAVEAAARLAGGSPPAANPVLASSTNALQFGSVTTTLFFELRNAGGGSLTVSSVQDDAPWLTVEPESVAADGTGRYRATVSREALADGVHEATITAVSSANTVRISVTMQVPTGTTVGDAGVLYILLVDPETLETVAQVQGPSAAGSVPFRFDPAPAGSFYLVAGSDQDNDGFICDSGEACGAYPTLGDLQVLNAADGGLDNLSFVAGFVFNINAEPESASAPDAGPRGWRRRH